MSVADPAPDLKESRARVWLQQQPHLIDCVASTASTDSKVWCHTRNVPA